MPKSISKKINLLNETALRAMAEENNSVIIRKFTDESIKIFEADFGYAWGKFNSKDAYELVYKSSGAPVNPTLSLKRKDNHIIRINYGDHAYGSIVLGYKHGRAFTDEELALSETIGNTIAQAITINWLIESERKARVLAEKQKATEILLSQENSKNEFIANATHEIRTPLAIIKGNIELAQRIKKKGTKFDQEVFTAINEEINRLSEIVSDLALLTSRAGREQTETLVYNKVNLKLLIDIVVKRCKTLAVDKNISITAKNIPKVTLLGNEAYLEKMFMNLIKNSITYGHQNGHTAVSARAGKGYIKVSIEDNGIGVSKEDISHVFERFYRGDKSHNSDGNRTGLGLAIVKWVAEIHGGEVEVKSNNNKGSIFSVTLPRKEK